MTSKSKCQKCGQNFEFEFSEFEESGRTATHIFGQAIDCPYCGCKTLVTVANPNVFEQTKVPVGKLASSQQIKQEIAKPIKQEIAKPNQHTVGYGGCIFTFIIGILLLIFGFGHVAEPEHGSILPQIYGVVELCAGWIMIALAILMEYLIRISRNK